MQALRGKIDYIRDRWAPISHTSTFRATGQITPEEFVLAGDYLVYKFPSWSWSAASSPSQAAPHLPPEKQYLVTRGVPCHRQLNTGFGIDGDERVVQDGEGFGGGDEEGWLSTGGGTDEGSKPGDVKALGDKGEVERDEEEEEEEIPDMDEDDDEAIIREPQSGKGNAPARTYTLYITYTPYYRTPRFWLSGYLSTSTPLAPAQMLEDIVGDYKDKTVTLEDFPFFDSSVQMASIHPCKHANVMKVLLDRADAALKLRKERLKKSKEEGTNSGVVAGTEGLEGLVDTTKGLTLKETQKDGSTGNGNGDEWEVLQHDAEVEDDVAIRVDQYIVVFLKFMASVTPGIDYDFTMGV